MSDNALFAVGNSPSPSIITATAPALVIGYTGSTGVSGGTGANIVKSYQAITNAASSKISINGNLNNYIEITPSDDVIVITPNPTGPIISDGSRINRIWLSLTDPRSYVEAGNDTCVDIFMNSSVYSIGGVSVSTNDYFSPSNYTIFILYVDFCTILMYIFPSTKFDNIFHFIMVTQNKVNLTFQ